MVDPDAIVKILLEEQKVDGKTVYTMAPYSPELEFNRVLIDGTKDSHFELSGSMEGIFSERNQDEIYRRSDTVRCRPYNLRLGNIVKILAEAETYG